MTRVYRAHFKEAGGHLVATDEDIRSPQGYEVKVRIRAASLNFRDLLVLRGIYPGAVNGVVPGCDAAGEVVEIGTKASRFAVGQPVLFTFYRSWIDGPIHAEYQQTDIGARVDGVLAQDVITEEQALVPMPERLSMEQGAALGCASVTAWAALMAGSPLIPGETLLVQGSGGVSVFALQFAKAAGAKVIAITSSAAKAARLTALGADAVINYREVPDWDVAVRQANGNRGVDRVIEVGGPSTFARSLHSLGVGGRLAIVGLVGGLDGSINPFELFGAGTSIHSINVGSRRHFEDSLGAMEIAGFVPQIDETLFAFADTPAAYEYLASGQHFGKVVINRFSG